MCPNGVYRVLIVPCRSFLLLMDSNGTLGVLISHYASLSVLIGLYRSFRMGMCFYRLL